MQVVHKKPVNNWKIKVLGGDPNPSFILIIGFSSLANPDKIPISIRPRRYRAIDMKVQLLKFRF